MSAFSYHLLRTAIRQYPQDRTLRLIRKTPQHVITGTPADGRPSPLHAACQVLDAAIAAALLDKGADANARTADGETPLHCALSSPDPPREEAAAAYRTARLQIVTMLLAAGASASAVDEAADGRNTPLHLAVLHGHVGCARLLLARDDFALTVPNARGEIPLFVVADEMDMDMAEFLTRWHLRLDRRLHRAVGGGDVGAVADALGEGGEDVAARSMLGDAAVHLAAVRGDVGMVRFLLARGADGGQAGYLGGTALHRAAGGRHGMDAAVQKGWGEAEVALFRSVSEYRQHAVDDGGPAASSGYLAVARALLDTGLSPNVPDALLRTPLHLAAAAGDGALVELLLAHGADPNVPDLDLKTPLWHAASSGNIDLMAVLLQRGASLHLQPEYFRDVGHLAVQCGRRCVTADMLNASDAHGRTPLIHAVQTGALAPVRHLLQAGAYAGQLGKGWSPLVQACDKRHWGVARLLVERGADVRECEREARTTDGGMALHLAARGGDSRTVREILRAEEARAEEQQQVVVVERSPAPSRRPSVQSFRSSVTMQSAWSGGGGAATKVPSPSPTAKAGGFYRWTPLHYAASMGHGDAVATLLGIMERTEIIARDIDGFTAQELAKGAGYEDIVRLVEERLT